MTLHEDEILIDEPLVTALLSGSLPQLAGLRLRRLRSSGSSNALFRLGDDYLVRLPRQPGGTATIDKEARWLPYVGPYLPVAVPEVVAVGEPAHGYPERWSVTRWLDGDTPRVVDPVEPSEPAGPGRVELARGLAAVVAALRTIPVPAAALSDSALRWYRGAPLADGDTDLHDDIRACGDLPGLDLDLDAVQRVWEDAMAVADAVEPYEPRWYHGDLLAENLLVRDGRLVAVLDFGGLSVGDPTVDLLAAWETLDALAREVFRAAVGVDDATWVRGRAWALRIAVMTFPYYWRTMPQRCADRLAMARSVLADAGY